MFTSMEEFEERLKEKRREEKDPPRIKVVGRGTLILETSSFAVSDKHKKLTQIAKKIVANTKK